MSKILYEERVKEEVKFEPEEFLSTGHTRLFLLLTVYFSFYAITL